MKLKDIARLAGVSPSAVSRFLNGGPLSREKSEKIREVIRSTGFRPNLAAQILRTGNAKQVGVIVPRVDSCSASRVLAGLNEVFSERGYIPLLGCSNLDDQLELRYLNAMQANYVAGIVVMGTSVTREKLDAYQSCAVPLVVTGQNVPGISCVHHDDYEAMKNLALCMLRRGRRRIGYLGVNEADPASGVARRRGAQDALREFGLDPEEMPLYQTTFDNTGGFEAAKQLLQEHPETDGILCATDRIAHGAMHAAKRAGKRVPQDIGIAGVGDDWPDELTTPTLTTVRLYHQACGRNAAEILLQMIEARGVPGPARQIMLGYTILEREST